MQMPSTPGKKPRHMSGVWRYTLHDRDPDTEIDAIIRLVAELLDVPLALLSMVDGDSPWLKSGHGPSQEEHFQAISPLARATSCDAPLEISDMHTEPRRVDTSLEWPLPSVRYYLGMPLTTQDGVLLGSLCILGTQPRRASERQVRTLEQFARQITALLELRHARRLNATVEQAGIGLWELDVASGQLFRSDTVIKLHGGTNELPSDIWSTIDGYHPEDRPQLRRCLENAINRQEPFDVALRMATSEEDYHWVLVTGQPLVHKGITTQVIGSVRNVNRLKVAERQLQLQHHLDRLIVAAQAGLSASDDSREAFEALLGNILTLVNGELGFIGEVFHRDGTTPFLKIHSITGASARDTTLQALYAEYAPAGMEFSNPDTLFGQVMRDEAPVINNRLAQELRSDRLPPDHPILENFLGVPIFFDGRMVAMLGLANRPGGFDQALIDFLSPLLSTIAQLFNLLHIRREQYRNQQEIARLSEVAKRTSNSVIISNADDVIEWVNDGFERLTGYSRQEAVGKRPGQLLRGPKTDPAVIERIERALSRGEGFEEEAIHYNRDNQPYWVHIRCDALHDEEGRLSGFIDIQSDLTHAKQHAKELYRAANFDSLTGLPNRNHLVQQLQDLLDYAEGFDQSLAVYLLDLDRFHSVNQAYGHDVADRLLIVLARRFQNVLKEHGRLARIGGDEFALIVPHHDHGMDALDHIRQTLVTPIVIDDKTLSVTASIGVSTYPQDDSDADMLLRHATQAMYQAKQRGGDCYQLFDAGQDIEIRQQRERLARLSIALEREEFQLYYQPQVDLDSQRVVGVEALIRWQHPQRGILPPSEFLPMLAGSELEQAIDEWVVARALSQSYAWKHIGIELPISVNLSPQSLVRREFLDVLATHVQRHPGFNQNTLKIEVLESAALGDIDSALRVMEGCRALGIELALDDFGTGYSSLSYLRNLPVDLIKIDRSFVAKMLDNDDDHSIVESVIFLARKFKRPVLAEGVESLEHAKALGALGCHLVQGYGIARPMPASDVPAWHRQWTSHASRFMSPPSDESSSNIDKA